MASQNNTADNLNHNHKHHLKYKICISGAAETGHCSKDAVQKAETLGRAIAEHGLILVTGATTGIPYWAAKGAKEAGGTVIGLSPAASKLQHIKTYKLPTDYHDIIIYTGFEYAGRNLLLVRSSDAIIFICGRIGTINEFTIGFEDKKPLGVLKGSGGTVDMIENILKEAHRGMGKTVFSSDPDELLELLLAAIEKEEKGE
ncbi:MAG: hypothetical protein AAB772_00315 [Patescibacteria group bacterium]